MSGMTVIHFDNFTIALFSRPPQALQLPVVTKKFRFNILAFLTASGSKKVSLLGI